jgi:hypothetical protein
MPQVFDGVEVWTLRRRLPPIDPCSFKKILRVARCMLRVVVLNESVAGWHFVIDEGYQSFL